MHHPDDYCFKVRNVCNLEKFLSSICFLSVIHSSKVLFYLNEVSVFICFLLSRQSQTKVLGSCWQQKSLFMLSCSLYSGLTKLWSSLTLFGAYKNKKCAFRVIQVKAFPS